VWRGYSGRDSGRDSRHTLDVTPVWLDSKSIWPSPGTLVGCVSWVKSHSGHVWRGHSSRISTCVPWLMTHTRRPYSWLIPPSLHIFCHMWIIHMCNVTQQDPRHPYSWHVTQTRRHILVTHILSHVNYSHVWREYSRRDSPLDVIWVWLESRSTVFTCVTWLNKIHVTPILDTSHRLGVTPSWHIFCHSFTHVNMCDVDILDVTLDVTRDTHSAWLQCDLTRKALSSHVWRDSTISTSPIL